jgi:hypothetical protein
MRLVALSFGLIAACQAPVAIQLSRDSSASPIIGGAECDADTFPATVAVLVDFAATFMGENVDYHTFECTGTLVAPSVVLTAAHCVGVTQLLEGMGGHVDHERYFVTRQADLSALAEAEAGEFPDDTVAARGFAVHPDFDGDAEEEFAGGLGDFHDLGILFLDTPLDIAPVPMATAAETSALVVGTSLSIVGWGQPDPEGAAGIKRCAVSAVQELGATEMQVGYLDERKCHGDSGGPSYLETAEGWRVVGVTSRAYDPELDCELGGVDTRVDAHREWLDTAIAECADTSGACSLSSTASRPSGKQDDESGDGCAMTPPSLLTLGIVAWLRRRRLSGCAAR